MMQPVPTHVSMESVYRHVSVNVCERECVCLPVGLSMFVNV